MDITKTQQIEWLHNNAQSMISFCFEDLPQDNGYWKAEYEMTLSLMELVAGDLNGLEPDFDKAINDYLSAGVND